MDVSRSDKLWDRVAEKDEFREYILKMMENDSLDIIISPVLPFPAPRNDITAHLLRKLREKSTTVMQIRVIP